MITITRAVSSSPPIAEPITTPVVPVALLGPIVVHCEELFIGTVSTQKQHHHDNKDMYFTTSYWVTHVNTRAITASDVRA